MNSSTALAIYFVLIASLCTKVNQPAGAFPRTPGPQPSALFAECVCECSHNYTHPTCTPGCTPVITSENFAAGACFPPDGDPPTCGAALINCDAIVKYSFSGGGSCAGPKVLSCSAGCGFGAHSENACLRVDITCAVCTQVP